MDAEDFANAKTEAPGEFIQGGRLVIPDLQRPFAWSEGNAGELISDVTQYVEHGAKDYYFLGSVVPYVEGGDRIIVDGQQRPATVTILLRAIRDGSRRSASTPPPTS